MTFWLNLFLMGLAGTPPTIVYGSTSFATTAPAATTPPTYFYSVENDCAVADPDIVFKNDATLCNSFSFTRLNNLNLERKGRKGI